MSGLPELNDDRSFEASEAAEAAAATSETHIVEPKADRLIIKWLIGINLVVWIAVVIALAAQLLSFF